jgi:hypothetical protein
VRGCCCAKPLLVSLWWLQAELRVLSPQAVPQRPAVPLSPFHSLNASAFAAKIRAEVEAEEAAEAQVAAQASSSSLGEAHAAPAAAEEAPGARVSAEQAATPAGAAGEEAGPSSSTPAAVGAGAGAGAGPDEGAVHEALLIQQFLEGTPSQLTWHGLAALHDGLRENQLAVFFR